MSDIPRLTKRLVQVSIGLGLIPAIAQPVLAQLIPDQTLPSETSVVQPRKEGARILGGARRGQNLFHSFREFNIGNDRNVYFANPAKVHNILTRVTGRNPSRIFGKLGVEGPANLFLVNPRGIIFGPNASLDIQGSFFTTTAERIPLGKTGFFDAVNPKENPILAIAPDVNFTQYISSESGSIQNHGNLQVGHDLSLSAQTLHLSGSLASGQNLNLFAKQSLTIRDAQDQPFVAASGEDLTLTGTTVDIFALNHPSSVLFSRGNTRLISPKALNGDAQFLTGERFSIQTPQGKGGDFESQADPVIRSLGDVSFSGYFGRSLHIISGGSVDIPDGIIITGGDIVGGIQETITLSDGSSLGIDGVSEPTLDIRAGVNPGSVMETGFDPTLFFPFSGENFILNPGLFDPSPDLSPTATTADIRIGPIDFRDVTNPAQQARTSGTVFLSNQYHPNLNRTGNITLTAGTIADRPMNLPIQGVNYMIDSRNRLNINRNLDAAGFRGGQVKLLAQDDIIVAPNVQITTFGGEVSGPISLKTSKQLRLQSGSQILSSGNLLGPSNLQGGNILIRAKTLQARDGARIQSDTAGSAQAGNIDVTANEINLSGSQGANVSGIFAQVLPSLPGVNNSGGNSGNIRIKGDRLLVAEGAQISTTTFGSGDAGSVDLEVGEIELVSEIAGTQIVSGIFARANAGATGAGGPITIKSDHLQILDGATILTDTSSPKLAGSISITTDDLVLKGRSPSDNLSIISASSDSQFPTGAAGNVKITAHNMEIAQGALLSLLTTGKASGGQFDLNAKSLTLRNGGIIAGVGENASGSARALNFIVDQIIVTDQARISNSTEGSGNGGSINFQVDRFVIRDDSSVIATSESSGNAGQIRFTDAQWIDVDNSSLLTTVANNASGNGGPIQITTERLRLSRGGQISSSTSGGGPAGSLQVKSSQSVRLEGTSPNDFPSGLFANVQSTGTAKGGNITVNTPNLLIQNGAGIAANSLGNAEPGSIIVHAEDIQIEGRSPSGLRRSQIAANARNPKADVSGGNISLKTTRLRYRDGAQITSSSAGTGDAGEVYIQAQGAITAEDGEVSTSARQGAGGRVTIGADTIRLRGDSDIRTDVASGTDGGGDININARSVIALDDSDILAFSQDGRGGNIRLNTPVFFGENQSDNPVANPDQLDGNQRVDLNASGAIQSGVIEIPDVSFIESNLSDLPETLINTDQLLANSCVARGRNGVGTFLMTGAGGLPSRPGQDGTPMFPTGKIRADLTDKSSHHSEAIPIWKPGDPIEEPDGVYKLANGDRLLWTRCRDL